MLMFKIYECMYTFMFMYVRILWTPEDTRATFVVKKRETLLILPVAVGTQLFVFGACPLLTKDMGTYLNATERCVNIDNAQQTCRVTNTSHGFVSFNSET